MTTTLKQIKVFPVLVLFNTALYSQAPDNMWTKTFEGTGHSVQQTSDGGYIIAGKRDGDVLIIKVAPEVTSIDENPHISVKDYH